jgi:hypothetical protein
MFLTKFQSKKLRIKLYKMGQILKRKYKIRAGSVYRKNIPVVLYIDAGDFLRIVVFVIRKPLRRT